MQIATSACRCQACSIAITSNTSNYVGIRTLSHIIVEEKHSTEQSHMFLLKPDAEPGSSQPIMH